MAVELSRVIGGAPQLVTIGADKTLAIWDTISFKVFYLLHRVFDSQRTILVYLKKKLRHVPFSSFFLIVFCLPIFLRNCDVLNLFLSWLVIVWHLGPILGPRILIY